MDLGLKGKSALVTGSTRGLGYATARLLAAEGACVAINGRDPAGSQAAAEKLQAETGGQVIGLNGDISQPEVPARLVEQAVQVFGGLDILITNSGGPPAGKFENLDDAAWESAANLVLFSHVRLIRAALPALRRSAAPSVLTVTSVSIKQPISNLVLSNSLRAATAALTKSLSLELGHEGIRFNSILPSWTKTQRLQELMGVRAKTNGTTEEAETAKLAGETALGRVGQPEEFARAAVFLVSPAASYITGVMLPVDGGAYKATY